MHAQMDNAHQHLPHPGVGPGMPPGVPMHGMPVHGGGPDGEHPGPQGQRRRYQNRPKPSNNLERLPLDEAAKREMEALPMKTPVSVLQELLARRGTVPKYELVQIEGMIHEPTFRYQVTVADLVAMGTGRSKKEAKHSAAKALLDKLTGNAPADQNTNGAVPEPTPVVSSFEDKLMGNPVGWLQELCMSRFWPPPSYHAENENDNNINRRLPHERQFTLVCTLLKRREVGTGKSKKLAKRQAAYKMWQALQDNPPESFTQQEAEPGTEGGLAARYESLKDSKISTLTTSHSHKVSQFHKHLKSAVGPHLAKLQEMEDLPMKTPVIMLQEYLAHRGTVPTYELVPIKGMIHEPTFRYLLVTDDDLVAMGTGRSKNEAKLSAAKALLDKFTGNVPADQNTNGDVPKPTPVVSSFEDKLVDNPVGRLQELCMSYFWPPPSYHAENEDNINRRLPHERQFTIVCTLLKRREVGKGKSKKLAKRQAAYKMWQNLQDNPPESIQQEVENGTEVFQTMVGKDKSKKLAKRQAGYKMWQNLQDNPPESIQQEVENGTEVFQTMVGKGKSKKLAKRQAAYKMWQNLQDNPPESIQQEVENGTEVFQTMVGKGKSKKLAKRQAAYKMWQNLQDNPPESIQQEVENGTEDGLAARYESLKDCKICTLTTTRSLKVLQFHKDLKSAVGPHLAKLQSTPLNNKDLNFVQFLQKCATEQAFKVTYVDIEERSITGMCQCLVQLSTLPVAVCQGAGPSSKEAQSSAAQNALEYLKIMTKK